MHTNIYEYRITYSAKADTFWVILSHSIRGECTRTLSGMIWGLNTHTNACISEGAKWIAFIKENS